MFSRFVVVLLFALLVSCGILAEQTVPPALPEKHFLKTPPNAKQAIQFLLKHHAIPLSIHESCHGVGTDFADTTIGDYFSGFLAAMDNASNAVLSGCQAVKENNIWRCHVKLSHADEEDEWRWGVRFDITKHAGVLIRQSIRCTGMG